MEDTRPTKIRSQLRTFAPGRGGIRIGLEQSIGAPARRRAQEDSCFAENLVTAGGHPITLAIVADGIGGESFGERASRITVDCIVDFLCESTGEIFPLLLEAAIRHANRSVWEEAQREKCKRGMGSTVTAALIHRDRLYLASVGDSRAYFVRGGTFVQLTTDHNWGEAMIRLGKLTPREAVRHPLGSALVRSIGAESDVQVDLGVYWNAREAECSARSRQGLALMAGDNILLCSDGLIKRRPDGRGRCVEPAEFPGILSRHPAPRAARMLVARALARNANDNVSAIVLQKPKGILGVIKTILRLGRG